MRLIIDTDNALGAIHDGRPRDVDDAFALLTAINDPSLALVGVTTVFGNAPLAATDAITRDLMARKGSTVPVATGAAEPLAALGDTTNDAVELMADALQTESAHIAAIGPLTNLGLLARRYPERFANAASVVVVGGRSVGNRFMLHGKGPVADFNLENDMDAARAVLATGVPVVMAGFELSSRVALTADDLAGLPTSTLRSHLLAQTRPWLEHWQRAFPGDAGFHPWDSAAIDWLIHPERYAAEQRGWRIVPSPDDAETSWLETGPELPRRIATFLTGFKPGGGAALVADIVRTAC